MDEITTPFGSMALYAVIFILLGLGIAKLLRRGSSRRRDQERRERAKAQMEQLHHTLDERDAQK